MNVQHPYEILPRWTTNSVKYQNLVFFERNLRWHARDIINNTSECTLEKSTDGLNLNGYSIDNSNQIVDSYLRLRKWANGPNGNETWSRWLYNGTWQDAKTDGTTGSGVSRKNTPLTVTSESAKWYLIGLTYDTPIIQSRRPSCFMNQSFSRRLPYTCNPIILRRDEDHREITVDRDFISHVQAMIFYRNPGGSICQEGWPMQSYLTTSKQEIHLGWIEFSYVSTIRDFDESESFVVLV